MAGIPTSNPQRYCVFGYGSLIWKPPPYYAERVPGFLKGFVRRFAQSSSDHRGTPEHPGRVVTLIAAVDWSGFSSTDEFPHEDVVWGVCYTISPEHAAEMREYLGTVAVLCSSRTDRGPFGMLTSGVNTATKIIARRYATYSP
ncbi:putative cation transporter ChaC [Rhizoctonia solani 123E]|uniref:glutathione-specific gamma-glutamylcyclotransferase n=1 Tax=Rhizoctonia solani 123E TaxID=1423351 RepID=A0A074RYQ9_9AGAM|nr:putative cation transporter ChaC [Rhizoctonia solani 123E]